MFFGLISMKRRPLHHSPLNNPTESCDMSEDISSPFISRNMTIPSRPAPAPPQQQQQQQQHTSQQHHIGIQNITIKLPPPPSGPPHQRKGALKYKTISMDGGSSVTRHFPAARYAPVASWDGSPFEMPPTSTAVRKVPPPRPPPPQVPANLSGNTVLKKPGPPQSVNVLANLFGRKKSFAKNKPQQFSASKPNSLSPTTVAATTTTNHQTNNYQTFFPQSSWPSATTAATTTTATAFRQLPKTSELGDCELIRFDSPPSSPTFTQKSNSDCVSVDSFSSDSNFSSPQNGSVSQPESGFEDDFTSPSDPWDPFSSINSANSKNSNASSRNYCLLNEIRMPQSVRNLNAINRNQNDNPLCNGRSLLPPQDALAMPTIIKPKTSVFPVAIGSRTASPAHMQSKNRMPHEYQMMPPKPINSTTSVFSSESQSSLDDDSLPMPSCPPPPPPPNMLDVINGQADALALNTDNDTAKEVSYGISLYDFDGAEDGDLSFRENEKVYLLQRLNDEWYLGRNKRGCEGIFPSNYVEVKVPLAGDTATSYPQLLSESVSSTPTLSQRASVRVLYNFIAEVSEDLTLKENDLVTVLYRINDDWLYGEINGQQGQFPSNFLEYIPNNLPQKPVP